MNYRKNMKNEELSTLINQSLGNKLIKAGRLFQQLCLEEVKQSMKVEGLKASHLKLFPFIKEEGSTVVELASCLEISKQATSLLVAELLEFKVLLKEENPNDKRSFLVKLNKRKGSPYLKGGKVFSYQDKIFSKLLSSKDHQSLDKSLSKILDFLEAK